MLQTIPPYELCNYLEVYRILEMRDGAIYKTIPTGKYIKDSEAKDLPKNFLGCSVSMRLLRLKDVRIDVVPANSFTERA